MNVTQTCTYGPCYHTFEGSQKHNLTIKIYVLWRNNIHIWDSLLYLRSPVIRIRASKDVPKYLNQLLKSLYANIKRTSFLVYQLWSSEWNNTYENIIHFPQKEVIID